MTFFRTVLGYKIQYTLLSFLCIGATVLVSWQHFVPANQTNFYTYSCSINNAGQGRTLKIRNVISNLSATFADKLCASKTLSQQGYSHVQIEWPTSKQLTARVLVDGQYDFILNRHHHLKGLVLDIDELYQPISIFSGYDIFWWNKFESPQLTAAFLVNKTIGVTSNTKSHPYYLIPLRSLSDAGIQLSEQQIKVFPSSDSLLEGFLNDDIDLLMWDKQIQKYSNDGEFFASQQGWQVEGLQWFAAKTTEHAVICEFTNGLSVYTAYLHSLNFDSKVLYDCP